MINYQPDVLGICRGSRPDKGEIVSSTMQYQSLIIPRTKFVKPSRYFDWPSMKSSTARLKISGCSQ